MQFRFDDKSVRYFFESLGEFGQWIERTPHTWPNARTSTDEGYAPSMSWDLNAGYDACVRMARDGWIEGAQRAQERLETFKPATPAPDTVTDFYGFRPHVPRFCAGAPDSMIRHAPVADLGCGKVLTLVVGLDANMFTQAEHMANFGVAVAQYVNQLESEGTRVELIGCCVGKFSSTGKRVAHAFRIKHADQPLDLAVVAFAIGHPGMLRRLSFAALERSEHPESMGYGAAVDTLAQDIINIPNGAVILNGMKDAGKHAPTPEAGLEYVSKQIEAAIQAL